MNKIKKIFFVCFILNFFVHCDDIQVFNKSNELYKKGSYKEALELYNSIDKKNSHCWFNLGNCYYKLDNFSYAIAYWKKALKGASMQDYQDIEFNISKAKEKLDSSNYESNIFGEIYSFIVKYLNLIPFVYVQIIFLFFWYLLFLLNIVKIKKKFLMLSIFLCNFFLFGCLGVKYNTEKNDIGIVIEKETVVYAGPSKSYHIVGSLGLAQEIKINQKKDYWLKISNRELTGWILSNSVLVV